MEQNRLMEIIRILLQHTGYITIQQLSELLNVSGKTVRNDLKAMGNWLLGNQLNLVKKTGVGVKIDGPTEQKLRVLNLLAGRISPLTSYSPKVRKIYITLRLITCQDNHCRIYELARELYVSRATIHKDVTSLTPLLDEYRLTLIRKNNNGVQLTGKERSLRDLMHRLMEEDNGYESFIRIVKNSGYTCRDTFIFAALDYTDLNISRFVELILDLANPFLIALPFHLLLSVLLRIFICLIRMLDGHFVSLSEQFLKELRDKPLYAEALSIADLLSVQYELIIPEPEIRYLQVHFLSLKKKQGSETAEKNEAYEITYQILANWEDVFHYPFSEDSSLHAALAAHIEPAVTRLRHGIPIENPLMPEIEKHYQNTFLITSNSLRFLKERYGCSMSRNEIGYISIYLASALERIKRPLNTILVSHGGPGAGLLLLQTLSSQIPEIHITSTESFLSVQKADLSQTDIILSTLELPLKTDKPIIEITPLMHSHELMRLKEILGIHYKRKNDPMKRAVCNVE